MPWSRLGLFIVLTVVSASCTSDAERLRQARAHWAAGEVIAAEEVLSALAEDAALDADSLQLWYAEVLLARGELRRTRNVLHPLIEHPHAPVYAKALAELSHTYFYLGYPDSAAVLARKLQAHGHVNADMVAGARAHHVLGKVAFYQAAYDSARFHQEQSLAKARAAGHLGTIADAQRQLGVLAWYEGERAAAETDWYRPALALYRQLGDRHGEATTLANLGLLHMERGDIVSFMRYELQAFKLRRRIGDQVGLADSYYFLSINPYNHIPPAGHAFDYLRRSAELSQTIGYAWGYEVAVRMLQGIMLGNSFEPTEAYLADSTIAQSGEGKWYQQQFAGRKAFFEQRWADALAIFEAVYAEGEAQGTESLRYHALQWMVRPLVYEGRWADALVAVQDLQESAPQDIRHVITEAELWLAQGDTRQAVAQLAPLAAVQDSLYLYQLNTLHPDVAFKYAAWAIHEKRAALYSTLTKALIWQQDTTAFHYLERERGLPFWGGQHSEQGSEALGAFVRAVETQEAKVGSFTDLKAIEGIIAEVQHQLLVEQEVMTQAGPRAVEVATLAELQAALAPNEVYIAYTQTLHGRQGPIIHPILDEPALYALAIRADTVAYFTLPGTTTSVEALLDVFRMTIQRGRHHPYETSGQASAHKLYQHLIAPLVAADVIRPTDHLIVSTQKALDGVPFQALSLRPPGTPPQFLIEAHAVTYVPSATMLVEERQNAPAALRSVLAAAPLGDALPYTIDEIHNLPDAYFEVERLEGRQATRAAILNALSTQDVVHLATHAQIHQRYPLYSSVALRNERLELHELLNHPIKASLVVLSACETGRGVGVMGEAPSGSDVVSFPRALLHAGARSVLTSRWQAEDAATAQLMATFYAYLGEHAFAEGTEQMAPAQALAQAQRRFLTQARAESSPYQHPFYWAGFALTGASR
ncbi:MAG: CHAT domain-containing protein [Bacteroidota bacterium]